MELSLTRDGRAGAKLLIQALRSGPIACVYLPAGRLPLAGLVIDRQIEFVGDPRSCLVGPLRIGAQGKVRLAGVIIEGDVTVEGTGVLHLIDAAIQGTLGLGGMSRTMIERCLLTVKDGSGIPALEASGRAQALISNSSIGGGEVVATLGPHTSVTFKQTIAAGAILNLDQDGSPPRAPGELRR